MAKEAKVEHDDVEPPAFLKKGDKGEKKKSPKLATADLKPNEPKAPGAGHNSGEKVPELIDFMEETLDINKQIKALNKAKSEIAAKVKDRFNIPKKNWNYEIAQRNLERDVRIQFEATQVDLKNMLGYQASLDLQPGTVARTEEELADPGAPRDDIINRKG